MPYEFNLTADEKKWSTMSDRRVDRFYAEIIEAVYPELPKISDAFDEDLPYINYLKTANNDWFPPLAK